MMLLQGKTAVITGCSRGIGRSILEVFAQNGADIWACSRTAPESYLRDTEESLHPVLGPDLAGNL